MENVSYWVFSIGQKGNTQKQVAFSSRFADDKVNFEDDTCIIVADGVVLNKKELTDCTNGLREYYQRSLDNMSIIAGMTGPFNALVYNKNTCRGVTFGNQTGDSSVFYGYDKEQTLWISNNYNEVVKNCKLGGANFNSKAAHYLLTYGFYADDETIVEGINKVRAGEYLEFNPSGCEVKTYHRFNFHDKITISMDDAIEQLDTLFRNAVRRCFDKDLEYGYGSHLADLSAGLDSRMTNAVAKDLGYESIVNISYSQSGSSENKFTMSLSKMLGNPLYYRSLDDATFLYDIDKMVNEEFGMAYYCGMTAARQFLSLIDFSDVGLEHTGQLGDVVISTRGTNSSELNMDSCRNSSLLQLRYRPEGKLYQSQEEFDFYTRYFQGTLATHYVRSNYTYAVSPFIDTDLLQFCASLPDEIRENHKLYWAWIDRKYPAYGKIPSSRLRMYNGMSLGEKCSMYSKRIAGRLKRDAYRIAKKLGLSETGTSPDNMNPHTYWYETMSKLRTFVNNFYDDNICLLEKDSKLYSEAHKMFQSKNALDKLMVISLLATIKHYCSVN